AREDSDPSQRLDFELTLLENSSLAAPLPAYPGARSARVTWLGNAPLALAGSWRPQTGAVLFNGSWQPIDVTVIADGDDKLFRISLHQLALDCSGRNGGAATVSGTGAGTGTCNFLQSSDVQMQDFAIGDLVLEDVHAITNSTLDSGNGRASMRLGPGSRIAIGHASAAGIELTDANFLVQEAVDVAIDDDGVVDLSSNGLTLYLPDLRVADMTLQGVINASDFRAHIPVDEAPMLGAEVSIRDIGVNPLPVIPRRPEFDARMELSHNQLGIDGLLRLAGIPLIEIDASHMLSSGSGSAQLQILPLHFDELFTNLGQIFLNFPFEADIIAGSASGGSALQWQVGEETRIEGEVRLDLDSLSGYYQETAILDLDAAVAGHLSNDGFVSDGMQAISIASVDPGMPITNIGLRYALDTTRQVATVAGLRANMFSGNLEASDIRYDIATSSTDFELRLQAIDLTRILSLAAYDGVRATG
ncbi:MAG: intermembrane phospholipid transport protein YdbH family protein, partial [Pseudomonas sp.]